MRSIRTEMASGRTWRHSCCREDPRDGTQRRCPAAGCGGVYPRAMPCAGTSGGCHSREADKGRDADGDGANHREDHLPGRGWHGDLSDPMRGVVAGDGGGRDKKQNDQQPEP